VYKVALLVRKWTLLRLVKLARLSCTKDSYKSLIV